MMPTPAELSLMAAIHADPLYKVSDQQERTLLSGLYRRKLVTDVFTSPGRKLTPEGLRLLLAAQEAAKESEEKSQREAEEKSKEKSRSWWQFWLGLILGWLLGCITPADVIDFICGLIH